MNLQIDGRAAYAYTGGKVFDPKLPTVVLVHGALGDHSVWALQSRSLAHHGCSVLAVDLPGHGRSAGPGLDSVDALTDWLLHLLKTAGVSRALLVGHSMGSLIALETAARLGTDALGLVMVGSAFPMKVSSVLLDTAANEPLRAIDMVIALSHSSLASKPSAPAPGFWLRGVDRALYRRNQQAHSEAGFGNLFHRDFSLCNAYTAGLETAQRVRCPVSIVVGIRDQMTPTAASRSLAAALSAETILAPSGHALMGEAPEAVLAAIRSRVPRN
ncbi:alpha/beta fold hydrolase [Piscinibacter sakaiensis]|uniref:alpha/beta fold hydrolase n=1 Tax=Piscinibacter sakaiensis TaxID=1547922 RepID=UPI003AB0A123